MVDRSTRSFEHNVVQKELTPINFTEMGHTLNKAMQELVVVSADQKQKREDKDFVDNAKAKLTSIAEEYPDSEGFLKATESIRKNLPEAVTHDSNKSEIQNFIFNTLQNKVAREFSLDHDIAKRQIYKEDNYEKSEALLNRYQDEKAINNRQTFLEIGAEELKNVVNITDKDRQTALKYGISINEFIHNREKQIESNIENFAYERMKDYDESQLRDAYRKAITDGETADQELTKVHNKEALVAQKLLQENNLRKASNGKNDIQKVSNELADDFTQTYFDKNFQVGHYVGFDKSISNADKQVKYSELVRQGYTPAESTKIVNQAYKEANSTVKVGENIYYDIAKRNFGSEANVLTLESINDGLKANNLYGKDAEKVKTIMHYNQEKQKKEMAKVSSLIKNRDESTKSPLDRISVKKNVTELGFDNIVMLYFTLADGDVKTAFNQIVSASESGTIGQNLVSWKGEVTEKLRKVNQGTFDREGYDEAMANIPKAEKNKNILDRIRGKEAKSKKEYQKNEQRIRNEFTKKGTIHKEEEDALISAGVKKTGYPEGIIRYFYKEFAKSFKEDKAPQQGAGRGARQRG